MGKQSAIIPFEGTLGNITFYKSADGYRVKRKGGVSGKRIAKDPAFQRTRENGAEFGRAGKAGKTLRLSLSELLKNVSDAKMVSRLTATMMRVLQADTVNRRGQRRVIDGDVTLLAGFDFNLNGKLSATLAVDYKAVIDRSTGELSIGIPAFIPERLLTVPDGGTHYCITSAGAAVDFEQKTHQSVFQRTAILPWNDQPAAAVILTHTLPPGSALPLFLAMGVEFYQEMNGGFYPLKSGGFNCLSLAGISGS
jgi:hypothetical protein